MSQDVRHYRIQRYMIWRLAEVSLRLLQLLGMMLGTVFAMIVMIILETMAAPTLYAHTRCLAPPLGAMIMQTRATLSAATTPTINVQSSAASIRGLLEERRVSAAQSSKATLTLHTPLRQHGRLFMTSTEAFITLGKHDIQWLDYNGLSDILAAHMPIFPLSLGYQGAFNHLSFLGSSPRDCAVMVNGRPTNDIALGAAYIEHLPPEMMEQAEIFLGSDAIILANNAAGAAINIQEIRHDSKNLYTRAWYQQANEQYTAADVDISYNIAPNWNLTLGARTQFGNRIYNNTGVSAWNARAIMRWNFSSSANISFSYLLTQHRVNLSGGVVAATAFDVNTSATVFNETRENTMRHDLALTGSAFLTPDSTVAASLTVFSSVNERNLERSTLQGTNVSGIRTSFFNPAPDSLIAETTSNTFSIGATGRIETRITLLSALEAALTAGGTLGLSNIQSSVYWDEPLREMAFRDTLRNPRGTFSLHNELSAFGRLRLSLLESINASGGARLSILDGVPRLSLGARLSAILPQISTSASIELWGDASRSIRVPSPSEMGIAAELVTPMLQDEAHILVLAGVRVRERSLYSAFSCDILVGFRNINAPIVAMPDTVQYLHATVNTVSLTNRLPTVKYINSEARSIAGASVMADWHVRNIFLGGNFVASGFAQFSLPLSADIDIPAVPQRFPLVYAGCTAQYEYVVGRSILRAGVRVHLTTPFQPSIFLPTTWSYLDSDVPQAITGNGVDIVAAARVGNAYIRATYQNALNIPAMTVALYPQYPSNIRISVALTIAE